MEKINLLKVHFLPKQLEEGVLYVSEEFGVAGHLCACGCKNRIITPIGPTEWSFEETYGGPSLYPSIGNWQLPCKSHYWITNGLIDWSYEWTEKQIIEGRQTEEENRKSYYDQFEITDKKLSIFKRIINWLFS
ncbi:MAG: hypothetical protein EOO90_13080 [Pedobacter sp.]|nr:MAG: hypothetical protein EOO90_13080 [Pedobacter sp.]